MIEILWHGRGGQGAFTAARLLGAAGCYAEGRYGLAFPSFGPERRGAPMRAYTKLDDSPVGDRSAIKRADYVVYLDDTLFGDGWKSELKPGGVALVNTTRAIEDEDAIAIDASGISRRLLGRDIPNTVFVAAICAIAGGLTADDAKSAIRDCMPAKLHAANIAVVDEVEALAQRGFAFEETPLEALRSENDSAVVAPSHVPPARIIPTLRQTQLDPAVYARNTCWDAGHLVTKNAGWRTMRPVVDESACIGCLVCYMDCPDGTIFKATSVVEGDIVAIDYDFCKGCGICAKACPRSAIQMIPEGGEE